MEDFRIKWTARAVKDLKKTYSFYVELFGEQKGLKIIQHLANKVDSLSNPNFVNTGASDEEFNHLKHDYKKLIVKHVKITYRLSKNSLDVYIVRVFDTRQHPSKNK